jgi:hypothetical protein
VKEGKKVEKAGANAHEVPYATDTDVHTYQNEKRGKMWIRLRGKGETGEDKTNRR